MSPIRRISEMIAVIVSGTEREQAWHSQLLLNPAVYSDFRYFHSNLEPLLKSKFLDQHNLIVMNSKLLSLGKLQDFTSRKSNLQFDVPTKPLRVCSRLVMERALPPYLVYGVSRLTRKGLV